WQFAITTVYHFVFVPITIGLSALVAGLQTAWVRTGKENYLRATKFWGKLFLINFAIGVVTGIVQEFQFGMNWSAYSRFVGHIFGTARGRAELTDFGAVLTNPSTLVTFPHTITACFLTAGAVMLAVSAWHLKRRNQVEIFRPGLKLGAWVVLIAGVGVFITG